MNKYLFDLQLKKQLDIILRYFEGKWIVIEMD